jgi:hypothetical protein
MVPGYYTRWTPETIRQEALKYGNRGAFDKGSSTAYNAARELGILEHVCGHMREKQRAWTLDEIKAEANKYTTRSTFRKGSANAYQSAFKRGWLELVCTHMAEPPKRPTPEETTLKAREYKTRADLLNNDPRFYHAAVQYGILDKVCSHMISKSPLKDDDREATFYVYKFSSFVGFGISTRMDKRHTKHVKNFHEHKVNYHQILELNGTVKAVKTLENFLKKYLPIANSGIEGFKTECVKEEHFDILMNMIYGFLTLNPNCGIVNQNHWSYEDADST